MDAFIIFLTEIKLFLENKKDSLLNKWDDLIFNISMIEDNIKCAYNKNYKNKVNKVKKYLDDLFKDLDESLSFLYDIIWYQFDHRFAGYIVCFIASFVFMILLSIFNLLGFPSGILLLSFLPIMLIPIDIIVTTSLFISKRFKRKYNNSIKRMKKEYGVKNSKDLVEAYKVKKAEEAKKQEQNKVENQKRRVREETKKTSVVVKETPIVKTQELTDSEFLEKMFGYVSCSRFVSEDNREKFLDEINNILNKYTLLKKENQNGVVNGYLRGDVEHLQSEYSRYVDNQERRTNSEEAYSMRFRK